MELFAFWFWALIFAEIILLFIFVEHENSFGATVSLFIFAACLQWYGDTDLIGFVVANPMKLLVIVVSYFVLGGIWGIIKWWIYSRDRLEEYTELRDEFLSSKGQETGGNVPPPFRREWKEKLERNRSFGRNGRTLAEVPKARDNKARIMRWMSFWPISMLWSFLDDFVKRVFTVVYYRITNFLQRISDNMFAKANVAVDLEEDDNS